MATQPSRPVARNNEPDLTPPEEIRARRIRRWIFLGTLGLCVLGVGIYFASPSIGGAIKAWQSRRLAREAFALIDQRKWIEAVSKARDAYFLRPSEPQSWRALARLASRTGQWAAALDWWKKVDEAHRLTLEDRRDFVAAALNVGDTPNAAQQVEVLLAQRTEPEPHDIVLAGQIAARQSDPVLALDYAERVLADKRTRPYDVLSAATLVLSATRRDSEPYASAWKQIEAVARDPKNPASLDALAMLAQAEALPPISPIGGNASVSLESPPAQSPTPAIEGAAASPGAVESAQATTPPLESTPGSIPETQSRDTLTLTLAATPAPAPVGRTMSLTEVADALENHPDARPAHKLLALEVRARQDPALTDQYVADAVERFGNAARLAQTYQGGADSADETLLALATWLNKIGRSAKTLEVLPEARAIQRQDLFFQYVNALAALQRWSEIKELLLSEHSVVDPMVQHCTSPWRRRIWGQQPPRLTNGNARCRSRTAREIDDARQQTPNNTPCPILPMPRTRKRSSPRRQQTVPHTPAGCVLRSRLEKRLKRKRSPPKSLRYGQMTLQPATKPHICSCCSARRATQPKQQSAMLRCSSQKNRGTGKREQRSVSPVFVWAGTRKRSRQSASHG